MKKSLWMAGGIVALTSAVALAQTSTLYFTCREYNPTANSFRANGSGAANNNDVGNQTHGAEAWYGGAVGTPTTPPADTPVMYVSPSLPGGRHIRGTSGNVQDRNTSRRPFQLWIGVMNKYTGTPSEEQMSSLGFSVAPTNVVAAGPQGTASIPTANRRGTVDYELIMYTLPSNTNASGTQLADGWNIITAPMTDVRMVSVPDSVADFGNGMTAPAAAGTATYRAASLMVTGRGPTGGDGCRNQLPTRYELRGIVDQLLITRVLNPLSPDTPTSEVFAWGYAGGVPETATANGSTIGATSTVADAAVEIRFKGDYVGLTSGAWPNGTVNATDANLTNGLQAVILAPAGQTALRKWLGDFAGLTTAAPPQGAVNATDAAIFQTAGAWGPSEVSYFAALAACP